MFRRRSVQVYFVLPAAAHGAVLIERSRRFIESLWGAEGTSSCSYADLRTIGSDVRVCRGGAAWTVTYLISQAATHGWRRTLPAALSPLISDGPIVVIAVFVLSRLPAWFPQRLRLAGGAFVLYLALSAVGTWLTWDRKPEAQMRSGRQTLLLATAVNLLNPNPWISWRLVMGPLLLQAWHKAPGSGIALLAGFYGVLVAG